MDRGDLICGTGISISADKVRGIRAAVCSEPFTARHTREHNGSQIIAFGAFVVAPEMAFAITDAFLGAEFKGGVFTERFQPHQAHRGRGVRRAVAPGVRPTRA